MSPWKLVAELGIYTEEQIEDMTWAEYVEILTAEYYNMSNKRKLNSTNPKYMDKSLVTTKEVIKRKLINNVNGVKIEAVWYKHTK